MKTVSLAEQILQGDRGAIAKAITLIESQKDEHRVQAEELTRVLLPHTGKAIRIGVSGSPGVGKSTFIEALGCYLLAHDLTVAVLAIDPSSSVSKGSLLGDKTRMQKLANDERAFIRPSPSLGLLGGIAPATRDAMLILEAAGFDVVIIETVGVGQSEIAISSLVDTVVLLVQPGSGDELQGIKKGVLEVADIVLVHKADGEQEKLALQAKQQYSHALSLSRKSSQNNWRVPVLTASSVAEKGIGDVWQYINRHRQFLEENNLLPLVRDQQAEHWMWHVVENEFAARFKKNPKVQKELPKLLQLLAEKKISSTEAAHQLLSMLDL